MGDYSKGSGEGNWSCGFFNLIWQHQRSEIGIELSKEHWGKGIASEAFEAVIRYGFEQMDLQRIEALIEPANLPSQKLTEKQGFIREALLRSYEFTCGNVDYMLKVTDYQKPEKEKEDAANSASSF